jgi:hypothetical protein
VNAGDFAVARLETEPAKSYPRATLMIIDNHIRLLCINGNRDNIALMFFTS